MKKTTIFIAVAIIIIILAMVVGQSPKDLDTTPMVSDDNASTTKEMTDQTSPGVKPTSQIAITKIQVGEKANNYPAKAFASSVQTKNEGGYLIVQSGGENYHIELGPQKARTQTPLTGTNFGIAINGELISLSKPAYWNDDSASGWMYRQTTQTPDSLLNSLDKTRHSSIIGYAADGFPIYGPYGFVDEKNIFSGIKELRSSYQLKSNLRPANSPGGTYDGTYTQDYQYISGAGALDECNSRFGPTPDYPSGTYYYVLSKSFPTIPRCFIGVADPSFTK